MNPVDRGLGGKRGLHDRLLAQHISDTTPRGAGNPIRAAFALVLAVAVVGLLAALLLRGCGRGPAKHRRLNPVTSAATSGTDPTRTSTED
jgi:hypothetical protein